RVRVAVRVRAQQRNVVTCVAGHGLHPTGRPPGDRSLDVNGDLVDGDLRPTAGVGRVHRNLGEPDQEVAHRLLATGQRDPGRAVHLRLADLLEGGRDRGVAGGGRARIAVPRPQLDG